MIPACHWHFYEAEALASNCRAPETCYRKPENVGIAPLKVRRQHRR